MPYQTTFSDNPAFNLPAILAAIPAFILAPAKNPNRVLNPALAPILIQGPVRFDKYCRLIVQTRIIFIRFRFPILAAVNRPQNRSAFADNPAAFGVNEIDGAKIGCHVRSLLAPGLAPVVSGQYQTVDPDGPAMFFIGEMRGVEHLLRAVGLRRPFLAAVRGRENRAAFTHNPTAFVIHEAGRDERLGAVGNLRAPGAAAVDRAQDHSVGARHPALLIVDERYRMQLRG